VKKATAQQPDRDRLRPFRSELAGPHQRGDPVSPTA